ncbi:MAG: DUF1576 domain-containing protein [Bacilli bacterium]
MKREKNNNEKYIKYFYLLGILFIIGGLVFDTPLDTILGLVRILFSEDVLITDYFKIGGFGAAMINTGLVCIYTTYLIKRNNVVFSGLSFAALLTLIGFSFFGKNIYNITPIYLGVYLYSIYRKEPFRQFLVLGIFSTCLAPLVGSNFLGSAYGMLLTSLLGVLYGFVIVPLSSHVVKFHSGYTLYNVGFAGGLFALVLSSIIKVFGFELPVVNYLSHEYTTFFKIMILVVSLLFISVALLSKHFRFKDYLKLLNRPNRVISDYFSLFDKSIVFFNVGITGLLMLSITLITNATIDGPIAGAIFTVMGFSAFGVNIKSGLPIMLGVFIMLYLTDNLNNISTTNLLIVIFSVGLSPLAGQYGFIIGIIAGIIQYAVVSQSANWQGAMNLYNNGFATGITAAVIFGIIEEFHILGGKKR